MKYCYLFFLVLLFAACATQVAPSGGPEDKLPPRVAGVYPAPNSTNLPEELYVKLKFDEWIATNVPRSAVTISPPLEKKIRLEVDGDELEITSRSPLDENTTYTLTIGTTLKDLHGNALAAPFQMSFSTGKTIDSLYMVGRVKVTPEMFKAKQYPSIALYPIGEEREHRSYLNKYRDSTLVGPDTFPRFTKEIPQFVTQSDSNGYFKLIGLHAGRYGVIAFLDKNGNRRLEISDEDAGVVGEIAFDSLFTDSLWIPLATMDTSLVELDSVRQTGASILQAVFNRPVLIDSLTDCFLFSGRDTLRAAARFVAAKTALPAFHFDPAPKADSVYTFQCNVAVDSLHRNLDTTRNAFEFTWNEMKSDTLPPVISETVPSSGSKNVFVEENVKLVYNKPVVGDSIGDKLYFTFLKDTVKATAVRENAVTFFVRPVKDFPMDAPVTMLQKYQDTTLALPDSTGFRDTVVETKFKRIVSFETVKKLRIAKLTGSIPGGNASTYVMLRSVETGVYRDTVCSAAGSFEFNNLLEGKYIVEYYHGTELGRIDAGSLEPFVKAKPWRSPVDTLVLSNGDNVLENLITLPTLPQE